MCSITSLSAVNHQLTNSRYELNFSTDNNNVSSFTTLLRSKNVPAVEVEA
ncbi:MAG: hypothetical protein LBN37_05390 [Bacteroidales bacterium]|nr:hypothetical protein [Bacteroidales bacterium]